MVDVGVPETKGIIDPDTEEICRRALQLIKDSQWEPPKGTVRVFNSCWEYWKRVNEEQMGKSDLGPWEPEEPQYIELSYDQIAKQRSGWKLHLNFDSNDKRKTAIIADVLLTLGNSGFISHFKLKSGQPGKEATVYVGWKDKAQLVAQALEDSLGDLLDPPAGNALRDDIDFTPKIMGRFEVTAVDPDFHHYGTKGHPLLEEDMQPLPLTSSNFAVKGDLAEAIIRADALLRQRYGVFYTGGQDARAARS